MAEESYKGIFKSTFLFSFVQVIHIATKVVVNKAVAILLGAEGLGIISLYNSSINMLKSGCGLGIKQSAVRDVAEANKARDTDRIAEIISVTNKVVLFTALLGFGVTIIGSPLLSKYSFGSAAYIIPFIILSVAVALNVYAEGQMAILTGMRRLRDLAMANIIGSVVGMLTSIPLYYLMGKDGIVPSLVIAALCLFLVTKFYVRRIKISTVALTFKEASKKAIPMIQMGSVLMIAGFAGLVFDLLVSSFIRYEGGFATVGYFQAGATIISGYFGIVLSAMTTDYYPRICGVNKDNVQLKSELNKQVAAGIILIYPLAVCFVYLAPIFISFLYSDDFSVSTQYTDFAIFGTLLTIASNCMGMIFMAKMESKLYLLLVLAALIAQLCCYIPLYHFMGLRGLGISYIMNGVIGLSLYGAFLYKKYSIYLEKSNVALIALAALTLIAAVFIRNIENIVINISLASAVIVLASSFSLVYLKKKMGINILGSVKNKLRKR